MPILTGSAAYALAEAFGWRYGLDQKPGRAKPFYAVIAASPLVGMLINFVGINPIDALFWTAVINGFLAPPLLVLIMLIANNTTVMGKRTNGRTTNVLGWATTAMMFAAAAALVLTWGTSQMGCASHSRPPPTRRAATLAHREHRPGPRLPEGARPSAGTCSVPRSTHRPAAARPSR